MTQPVPERCLELLTTLRGSAEDGGVVTLAVHESSIPEPTSKQVVVKLEASPINPSDLGLLFAAGDLDAASADSAYGLPSVTVPLSPKAVEAQAARLHQALPAGNEGAGTVVAAGSSPEAQALLGRTVSVITGNTYAQYRTVDIANCLPMHEGVTPVEAASWFVNPMTALSMVETMKMEGHKALIHTVGASNLGRMLNRICLDDRIGLVNLVRRPEHVELLRNEGAIHVVDTSADDVLDQLDAALAATRATIAFDAVGGGELASMLLASMERVASAGRPFSRYGSDTFKQVYLYGNLDRGPTTINREFGMSWSVAGWLLRPFLGKLGSEGTERLRQRVADEITTTFASTYGMELSLTEMVDPVQIERYSRMASGDKALLRPHAGS